MELLRCSEKAFARCPSREICGNIQDAMFMEDSDCDRFNRSVADQPMTNGDWIRSMGDEELAQFMCRTFMCQIDNCPGAELCTTTDGKANGMLKWLRKPYQEGKHEDST